MRTQTLSRLALLPACLAIAVGGGCATLVNSADQNVSFVSDPEGALVKIDGVPVGRTPAVVPVRRKGGSKTVHFELPGYKTTTMTLKKSIDGWVAGNLLIGGIIGLGIDAVSGRGGSFPNSVSVVLEPGRGVLDLDAIREEERKNEVEGDPNARGAS